MDYGIAIFLTDETIGPAHLARLVEERGFSSLWVPEHTHIPAGRSTRVAARSGQGSPAALLALPRPVRVADGGGRGHHDAADRHRHLPA